MVCTSQTYVLRLLFHLWRGLRCFRLCTRLWKLISSHYILFRLTTKAAGISRNKQFNKFSTAMKERSKSNEFACLLLHYSYHFLMFLTFSCLSDLVEMRHSKNLWQVSLKNYQDFFKWIDYLLTWFHFKLIYYPMHEEEYIYIYVILCFCNNVKSAGPHRSIR